MSLPERPMDPIPEETIQIARAAFPQGNRYMQMRDALGSIYSDEMFADLYPQDGQPAVRPWRLALVTVMQFAENLSDRQAADAVRDRIAWKYALSLELSDAGFNYSVLSEFRQRLLSHAAGQRLLDAMLQQFSEKGLLKGRGKQRTDATHILAAVRQLNQLELVHETLRHALNELAFAAPQWVKERVTRDWFERYSQRTSNYLLPKNEKKRQAWAEQVGRDGLYLLEQVYQSEEQVQLAELAAIEILRQVWLQNYYLMEEKVYLREKKDQPPAAQRISSPYDGQARFGRKLRTNWLGYKLHLTETCDAEHPLLITAVETRSSTEADHSCLETIHQQLAAKGCLPAEHFVDQGYLSVEQLLSAEQEYGIDLLGPVPEDTSWQARQGGYDSNHFHVDWEQRSATCPQGKQSSSWTLSATRSQRPVVKIKFKRRDCRVCPSLNLCTRNTRETRRTLTVLAPQEHYEVQQRARQRQKTDAFRRQHAVRAGVEGTISQAAFTLGARRSRYRGRTKTHLQHLATAAAINLCRVLAWLEEVPRSATRQSHFAALAA